MQWVVRASPSSPSEQLAAEEQFLRDAVRAYRHTHEADGDNWLEHRNQGLAFLRAKAVPHRAAPLLRRLPLSIGGVACLSAVALAFAVQRWNGVATERRTPVAARAAPRLPPIVPTAPAAVAAAPAPEAAMQLPRREPTVRLLPTGRTDRIARAARAPSPVAPPLTALGQDRPEPPPTVHPSPPDLGAEARAVAEVLAKLNLRADPAGTLAAVATYRERFPQGKLTAAIDAAEVGADRALGAEAAALSFLDQRARQGSLNQELGAQRVELLSRAGRCPEARAALAVAQGGPDPPDTVPAWVQAVRSRCLAAP